MNAAARLLSPALLAVVAAGCALDAAPLVPGDGGLALGNRVLPGWSADSLAHFQKLQVGDLLLASDGKIVVAVDTRKRQLQVLRVSSAPDEVLATEREPRP